MTWIETTSLTFTARHEEGDRSYAEELLDRLEDLSLKLEDRFEVGMVLEGWEVKSLRDGKVQLTDGYVVIRNGELFIIGCQINPLRTASSHVHPDAVRTKKLLLHKDEIRRLIGKIGRAHV